MLTIHKFDVPIREEYFEIKVSESARVLAVQVQSGGYGNLKLSPKVWLMTDPDAPQVKVRFAIRGTGHDSSDLENWHYVGTFQIAGYVWHLFCGPELRNV